MSSNFNMDICTAEKKPRTFREYCNYLYEFVSHMFAWKLDFAPDFIIERYLIQRGTCGIFLNNGNPVIAAGGYAGAPDKYGLGTDYIGSDYAGNTYRGKVNTDVVVLWNNHTLSNDIGIISSYASRFIESDKSILNVLMGARITGLVTATDNTDKYTLDNVKKAIEDGETVVAIPPAFREIDALDNGVKRFDILRFTDPKDTDKLQYLTRYRDDLLSAFLNEFGLPVECVNKLAQVSADELHSMDSATNAIIESRLSCRTRDLDIVRSWGFDISVEPGKNRGAHIEFEKEGAEDEQETI